MSDIKYSIEYSRRKSICITVSPVKGVIVRAPVRTSLSSIEKLVSDKSEWIRKHLVQNNNIKRISYDFPPENGSVILFLGKEKTILFTRGNSRFVKPSEECLEIGLLESDNSSSALKMMTSWYGKEAAYNLSNMFYNILSRYKEYDFNPAGLSFRRLKSRWGSCSSKGKITLNAELIKLDPAFAEYVIIHELCHLKHHNHGRDFYRLLGELYPDYQKIRKELRMYTTR